MNYWYAGPNENCLLGTIITTESRCQAAANALGIPYHGKAGNHDYRPAGCYATKQAGFDSWAYLNNITDASITTPEISTGICGKGISFYILYLTSICVSTYSYYHYYLYYHY